MKMIDPTDDELNAAFAEKVAGMKPCGWTTANCGPSVTHYPSRSDFTTSADAVLPWLSGHQWSATTAGDHSGIRVEIDIWSKCVEASDVSFPRAAVIALLRAHNVEIEFTK